MGSVVDLHNPVKLPALGEPADPEFLENVKEILEVWRSQRGDPLDSIVTQRFLFEKGLIDILLNGVATSFESPPDQPALATGVNVSTIEDRSIAAIKMVLATLTNAEIAAATITGGKIATLTITGGGSGNIAPLTITGAEIVNLTIQGGKIASATITVDKLVPPITTATAATNYTVLTTDRIILADATSGNVTIDLLDVATAIDGYRLIVKRIDSSGNTVTVDGDGSETIDGLTTQPIGALGSLSLVSDGTEYWII